MVEVVEVVESCGHGVSFRFVSLEVALYRGLLRGTKYDRPPGFQFRIISVQWRPLLVVMVVVVVLLSARVFHAFCTRVDPGVEFRFGMRELR